MSEPTFDCPKCGVAGATCIVGQYYKCKNWACSNYDKKKAPPECTHSVIKYARHGNVVGKWCMPCGKYLGGLEEDEEITLPGVTWLN